MTMTLTETYLQMIQAKLNQGITHESKANGVERDLTAIRDYLEYRSVR